jgi:hypothetical protein
MYVVAVLVGMMKNVPEFRPFQWKIIGVLTIIGLATTPQVALAARPIVTGPTIGTSRPNVCETPKTPHGVPVPYPNTAQSSTLNNGPKRTVKIKSSDETCTSDGDDDSEEESDDDSDD